MLLRLAAQLLWPARCAACNAFVPEGVAFCESCRLSVSELEQVCAGCGLPMPDLTWEPWEGSQTLPRWCAAGGAGGLPTRLSDASEGSSRCHGCRAKPLPFSRVWPALAYGGAATEAVLHLKHGRRRHLARPLGALLAPAVGAAIDSGVDTLCPVPLHPRRLRQRGFNQALEILRVAERLVRRPGARSRVVPDGLRRIHDTPALGWESPASRRRIVAGAFAVHGRGWAEGRRILLVDDVMTTGATLAECTRVLLKDGAADVQVTALARVV